jgi:hypothetical protein
MTIEWLALQSQPKSPIIVRIYEPPGDPSGLSGLADVLIGSLGLTGAIVLAALVLGLAFGGVVFWFRSRAAAVVSTDIRK